MRQPAFDEVAPTGDHELKTYIRAVRKYWWIVALATALGLGISLVATLRAEPEYESSVTWFVSTPTDGTRTALQADQYAQRRVNSYVGVLDSEALADRVLRSTGITDMTRAQVQNAISATADLNTVLLSATVTDTSDTRSLQIAGAVAAQLGVLVDDLDNGGSPDAPNVQLNVISGPTLNPVPVSPRPALNIGLGLLVGLAAGLALAVLRQVLDTTVRSPQALRALTKAPVLGVIAYDRGAKRSPLISDSSARSLRAESFRQLRTNLQFVDVQQPVRVLVVTSSLASEGKSSTAVNLAMTFSDSGQRVLLIEADLRRPRVADYMGLERSVGLTNVLLGQVSIDDVLQPWGRGGLTVLPSGTIPPNPSELLGSPSMAELLDALAATFDMVVIDTPPLLPVTDAAVAATRSDGAVLVVHHGKTSRHDILTALRSLEAVGARFLGTILTMAPTRGADGYGSSRYGYYEDEPRRREKGASQTSEASAAAPPLPIGYDESASSAPPVGVVRRGSRASVPES